MTRDGPLIIVTVPSRLVPEVALEIRAAKQDGADVAEIRVDRLDAGQRDRLPEIFPGGLPLLATLRSKAEGGEGPDSPDERRGMLESLAELPFDYVDVEVGRDLPIPPDSRLVDGGRRLVLSHHSMGPPKPPREASPLYPDPARILFGKSVGPASVREYLQDVLPLMSSKASSRSLTLTTGPSGGLSRAWARRLSLPAVFAGPSKTSRRDAVGVEPSQLPVDHLRFFLDGPPESPLFALVGHPVAHSGSPGLHFAWMNAGGHRGIYLIIDLQSPGELRDALPALAEGGFRGLNVTHPLKRAAFDLTEDRSARCERAGVANTLTLSEGAVSADNTDVPAIERRLAQLRLGNLWPGDDLLVVGSGGAARATLAAAVDLHCRLRILGRNQTETRTLSRAFGAEPAPPDRPSPASLVVHATPAGQGGAAPLEFDLGPWLDSRSYLLDFVYSASDPRLRETASRRGAQYEDGWRLLVDQAAESYRLWWGEPPSSAQIAAVLREEECAA